MKTPPQIVYELHGSPPVHGCEEHDGRCYVCVGEMLRGQRVQSWLGSNYTDQNRARCPTASRVCEACCFIHAWNAPLGRPAPTEGKRGMNIRMVGHLYEEGWNSPRFAPVKDKDGNVLDYTGPAGLGYINANKGEKPAIREFLQREHRGAWFAAIADSGQKHVLPFAPLNGRGRSGMVLMDELIIPVPEDVGLIDEMAALLTAGATKDELQSGAWSPRAWELCGPRVADFEQRNGLHRGGPWFTLALWLAQRDEKAVAARLAAEKEAKANAKRAAKRAAKNPDRRAGSRAKARVPKDPELQHPEALDADPRATTSSRAHDNKPRGVGEQDAARLADPRTGQLRIPGLG